MKLFLTLFILVANVVGLLLVFHSFDNRIDKNKKFMYTMICFGIMYILTLIIYFFGSLGINNENVTESSRNFITFTFVPINTIILLPILIKSFNNRKMNKITTKQLNRTATIMAVVAIILIIIEFFSFRSIQKGIIQIFNERLNEESNQLVNMQQETNTQTNNENAVNEQSNVTNTNNEIENKLDNQEE